MHKQNRDSFFRRPRRFLLAFTPAIIWAGLIYWFSAQQVLPSLHLSTLDFLFKKTGHIVVYAVLYFLVLFGFKQVDAKPKISWWLSLITCLLYAISDELHQSHVSGRTASIRDVGYDFLGMSLVILRRMNFI